MFRFTLPFLKRKFNIVDIEPLSGDYKEVNYTGFNYNNLFIEKYYTNVEK